MDYKYYEEQDDKLQFRIWSKITAGYAEVEVNSRSWGMINLGTTSHIFINIEVDLPDSSSINLHSSIHMDRALTADDFSAAEKKMTDLIKKHGL